MSGYSGRYAAGVVGAGRRRRCRCATDPRNGPCAACEARLEDALDPGPEDVELGTQRAEVAHERHLDRLGGSL